MEYSITFEGIEDLKKTFQKYEKEARKALEGAVVGEAETVIGKSKEGFVPVDTGTLRASGHVQMPKSTLKGVEVTMGFGGSAAPYALAVHENLQARHTVGQAKYLERPFLEAHPGMAKRIAGHIKKALAL